MSAGTIILIVLGIIILAVLLGIFFFLFSLWKGVFVAREVLDKADTAMEWGKRATWGKKFLEKRLGKGDGEGKAISPQPTTSPERDSSLQ